MNEVPSGERVAIGFFGLRNAGKSSLVNAVTGQNLALVSDVKGTTTDPVRKSMELLPLGPVVIIDTPGLDDEGELGKMRVAKAREIIAQIDVAVVVRDAAAPASALIDDLEKELQERGVPYVNAYTKADLHPCARKDGICVSSKTGQNIAGLKELIAKTAKANAKESRHLIADLLCEGDIAMMVVPIDAAAPKGRIILPQQQVLRDILGAHATAIVCQPEELAAIYASLPRKPRIVVTDSQVFGRVDSILPKEQPLTSFSILFARYKGDLAQLAAGAKTLETLKDGDRVLISEGCTHHRQCGDIGTEKLPKWITAFAKGAKIVFEFTSGNEFPQDLAPYRLVVHCGGCMLNAAAMASRLRQASAENVPVVNYGLAIAHMHGILSRSLEPFA
ncbi:MAG: [Kiritimatiellae bacterium]|nr:[FeFe] hydrogenase H-cluster maturation GTPase HydF [Kiritimatiellia bacterium]